MRKILFVDDEVQILKAINRIFADSGYRIYFSGSAEAALQIMSSNIIDMVITDMRMPGMDGIEASQILGTDQNFAIQLKELLPQLPPSASSKDPRLRTSKVRIDPSA